MILSLQHRRSARERRNAFTLLEVLVVVAIIVVLASVGSIYVFRYLDDAKVNEAYLKAKNIEKAYKSYLVQHNDSQEMPPLTVVIAPDSTGKPYLEGGSQALMDPWGKQYQLNQQQSDTGDMQIEIWTSHPNGNAQKISSLQKPNSR